MNKNMDIRHEEIKNYILDECNSEQLKRINTIKQENPAIDQLINILDELKKKSKAKLKQIKSEIPNQFSEIDSIIIEIQSGTVDAKYAQKILSWLVQSPSFFEKLLTKLNQVSMMQSESDLPELQEVAIKSDEEILEKAGIITEQHKIEKRSIFDLLKYLIDNIITWFQVKPKLAYSLSTAVVTFLIIVFTIIPPGKQDPFESYRYADKVPYEYDINSFRGQSADSKIDPLIESFKNEFKMGISDYLICDYENAIRTWEEIKPIAEELEINSPNENSIQWIREYYFYLGVSHLALSRNTSIKSNEIEKYYEESIKYLLKAYSIISKYKLRGNDRETYFLGLVYGFKGNTKSAIKYFKKLDSSSKFYKDGKKIFSAISEK